VSLPTVWAGLAVIPVVSIKGAYIQKAMAGLLIEVSSLMVGDTVPKDNDVVAFL